MTYIKKFLENETTNECSVCYASIKQAHFACNVCESLCLDCKLSIIEALDDAGFLLPDKQGLYVNCPVCRIGTL